MVDPLITLAFVTGFLGSAHCIGMCGGIVSALSLTQDGRNAGLLFHLLYNLGRTLTYVVIGILVGWVGSMMAFKGSFQHVTRLLLIASDLLVILLGLGSAGLFQRLNLMQLEFAGPVRILTQAVKGMRQWPRALAALPFGLLFGLLPCGFLYAMLLTAAQSADGTTGGLMMAAFGLGTVPALLLVGGAAQWFSRRRGWMLRGAGLFVALMGCYNLWRHLRMIGMTGGMHH